MLIYKWKLSDAYLSKLQHGLKRSTKILIFSSSPKERYGMMRSRPCSTLGLERTNGVFIWSNNMTSWSLSPVSSRLPCKRQTRPRFFHYGAQSSMLPLYSEGWTCFSCLPCPLKSQHWLHPEWSPWCSELAPLWRLHHCPYSPVPPLKPGGKRTFRLSFLKHWTK